MCRERHASSARLEARGSDGAQRRSDRSARRVVWRRAVDAISQRVIQHRVVRSDGVANRHGWRQGGPRLGGLQYTNREKWTVLAILTLLFGWAAGHVSRHRRHVGHRGRRPVGSRRSHHWRHRQADGHEDRQKEFQESTKIHIRPSHGHHSVGSPGTSQVRNPYGDYVLGFSGPS
jgi:hypothetical protein